MLTQKVFYIKVYCTTITKEVKNFKAVVNKRVSYKPYILKTLEKLKIFMEKV